MHCTSASSGCRTLVATLHIQSMQQLPEWVKVFAWLGVECLQNVTVSNLSLKAWSEWMHHEG